MYSKKVEAMKNTEEYCLVKFHKKTGKIDTTLEAVDCELLKNWAIKATPKTKESIIFHKSTGEIICYISGTPNGEELYYMEYGTNIETFCPGILSVINS